MGPLKGIKNLPKNFLVMNGDILTDLNFNNFFKNHVKNNDLFTISSYERKELIDYGLLKANKKNILTKFTEKPYQRHRVSMGIYMVKKKILDYIPNNKFFGFDHLMHKLIKLKRKVKIQNHSGYWLDIGRPSDYIRAIEEFKKLKKKILHA